MRANDPEDFLRYYQAELTYLRKMGLEFAAKYPRVAPRLELGPDESPDPHVERLLESFAFLTARIQQDIDSEFPEITTALLGILYPHLINPVPSQAICCFEVAPDQGKLTTGHLIDRNTPLFAQATDEMVCRFRTCYPVTLWPIEVTQASIESPTQFDFLDRMTKVAAVLRLKLKTNADPFHDLAIRELRFYLNANRVVNNSLYELIFSQVSDVVLYSNRTGRHVNLPKGADSPIAPVGFGRDEETLPYPKHAHPGYRLIQEYFTFPEKFLFFDLKNIKTEGFTDELDILFLLDRVPKDRLVINAHTFRLGCTPIVNLFTKTTEPIRWDHRQNEYRLVADMRRERVTEIHSIRSVSASSNVDDKTQVFEPFYSFNHGMKTRQQRAFWHTRRVLTGRKDLPGTDVLLSFLDLDFKPSQPPTQTVYAHALCTNRDLAEQLSAGERLQMDEAAPLHRMYCLTKPIAQVLPPLRGATLWKLISQLSLNHLSLTEGADSLLALQEILRLYSMSNQPSIQQQIMGIRAMTSRKIVHRIGEDGWRGFCRGIELTLEFDEQLYVGSGAFLLGAILSRFFALYGTVNSFTRLVTTSRQREGIWYKWPHMAGERAVL